MAGVFIEWISGAAQWKFPRPGLVPRQRIFNRKIVVQSVCIDSGEAFGYLSLIRHASIVIVVIVILSMNNKGVVFPVCDRISLPLKLLSVVFTIQSNYARCVNHFVQDYDMVFCLDDLHIVIICARNHRRTGIESHKAAVNRGAAFGAGTLEHHLPIGSAALSTGRVNCWSPAIGWIINKRGSAIGDRLHASLIPEIIVGDNPWWISSPTYRVNNQVSVLAAIFELLPLLGLFRGKHFEVCQFSRTIQRGKRSKSIGAL